MLVTSTLLFLGFAARSAIDGALLVVRRRATSCAQRAAARLRLRFLAWYALTLGVIYGVYLMTLRR